MAKAARRVKRGKVRLFAVMTDAAGSWGSGSGIVSAFDNRGQARDEMNDLRNPDNGENERWWIQAGVFIPDQKRAAPTSRKQRSA